MRSLPALAGLLAFLGVWGSPARGRADEAAFRSQVAPLLTQRCLSCHSGPAPKGGLSLENRSKALSGGASGQVILPGRPDASLLLDFVSGDDPAMPQGGPPLSPDEVAVLEQWIAAGAPWPADVQLDPAAAVWWSLRPLSQAEPPAMDDPAVAAWVRNPIDAFILARLRSAGLSPSPPADRRTLIRRLSFDLLGLPPTPEEVEAFVADADPQAYERLVERLLASPRYGERWARHWLDLVHYGETHGYDKDKPRPNAWPYRDYVIRAFNEDKPYAQFIREQLAGDVLFPESPDGVVATGFIAAGPWDFVGHVELREGTTDKDITRYNDRDDMLSTACSTFLSLTVHCARCHDHKFDTITQDDYYNLQAVFAGVERADRPYEADPALAARRVAVAAALRAAQAELAVAEAEVAALKTPELVALEARTAHLHAQLDASLAAAKQPTSSLGYHSAIEAAPDVVKWVQVDLGGPQPIETVLLGPSHVVYGGHPGPGFGFPVRFKLEASHDSEFATDVVTLADYTAADFANPGDAPLAFVAPPGLVAQYVRLTATRLWERTSDYCLAVGELAVLSQGANLAAGANVAALDSIEAGEHWGRRWLVDGQFGETNFTLLAQASAGDGSPSNGYHSAILPTADAVRWVQVDLGESLPLDDVALVPARPTDFADTPGFGFPVRFKVEASDDPEFAQEVRLLADHTGADFPNPGDVAWRVPAEALAGVTARYVRVTATKLWERSQDFVFALAELQIGSDGRNAAAGAAASALDSIEAGRWSTRFLTDGFDSRAPLQLLDGVQEVARLAAELRGLSDERRTLAQAQVPAELQQRLTAARAVLAECTASAAELPPQPVVYAAAPQFAEYVHFTPPPAGRPRTVHVLGRGSVRAQLREARPAPLHGVPGLPAEFDLPDPDDEGARRVALAEWIADERNPLTWRSIANRVWLYHFGRGLVDSPSDFGRMGAEPTHPELLDWLARELLVQGGSLKALHRLIVTSATYRQSSADRPECASVDAGNELLWRMHRRRLDAECLHDAVLATAGTLDLTMGGPSVQQFFFKDDHSPVYDYARFDPEDPRALRRSVYRFIVRSVPDPFMDCLDAADPSILTPKRNTTLTALQALALLNNPLILSQARRWAEQLEAQAADPAERLRLAFRTALQREPTAAEAQRWAAYAAEFGWPATCRVLFNLNEFAFVD